MDDYILNKEQRLVILLSRLTFTNEEKNDIKNIVLSNINWFEFYKHCLYHKVLTLAYKNLNEICPKLFIPNYISKICKYSYNGIKTSNQLYMEELKNITKVLQNNEIEIIPVKGAFMVGNLYKDYGTRFSGDLDLLVRYSDIGKLDKIMKSIGYNQGCYQEDTNTIIPISRAEELKWKIGMSNLYPYYRLDQNNIETCPYYKIDFRHSLDDNLDKSPVDEFIEYKKVYGHVSFIHMFIHLCTHFYDEAKHITNIYLAKEFNIIKLCDIREFVLHYLNQDKISEVIDVAKKFNLQKQVYFTMYYLQLIYEDGYEIEVMNKLNINDYTFLDTFGQTTKNDNKIYNKNIWERIFSCNNIDELDLK